ncbi:MAG TPA: YihY/virulence factor BrkB family protein [Dehalococcoidia bacterium]|nr:YihY/virulence factor BrkB family protein [Dehalococcoidia bacterium]
MATVKRYTANNCGQLAAGIAYYVLFSIFPLLIFLVAAVGIFLHEAAQQDLVNEVMDVVPLDQGEGRANVEEAVDAVSGNTGPALGIIGLIGMMWSASGMFGAIRRSLNIIYDAQDLGRPFVQAKAIDLSLVLGAGLFFGASIAVTAVLRVAQARSEDLEGIGQLSEDLGWVWTLGIIAIPFVFSFVAFTFLYWIVPARGGSLMGAVPGAVIAAVAFEAVKNLFGFYVQNFGNFDVVFGSLGAVAAFLFWIFISAQILLIGAAASRSFAEVPKTVVKQPAMEGMKVPLHVKVLRTARSLVLRDPEADKR